MNWSRKYLYLLAVLGCGLTAVAADAQEKKAAPAPPKPPAGVEYLPDIEYGTGGDQKLRLDLAKPAKLERAVPCILVIHGGAWAAGDKKQHTDLIFKLAEKGYVAVTVGYRLCPKYRFPAQVEDVKCAVRYLRAHADEHKINPSLLGAVGFSAGAHLSMMLGTMGKDDGLEGMGGNADQSSQVQCVVAFFGPTDLTRDLPPQSVFLVSNFMGTTLEEDKGERKRASPLTYLDQGDAPMLLLQGTKDPLVPHSHAIVMGEAMSKAGVPGRVELLIGAGHGWGGDDLVRSWEESLRFFGNHLQPKPVK
jgi:acetyl esterase/lipase